MAKFIEARVIQKVDTEANWMANPLKLYQGEVAFVSDKYNFKLNTTETPKTFAELEYYYRGDIIGGVLPTDDLASKPNGVYRATISGTYGGVVVKEGYYTLLRKDNGVWKLESEVEMPMQDLTPLKNKINDIKNDIKNVINLPDRIDFYYVNGYYKVDKTFNDSPRYLSTNLISRGNIEKISFRGFKKGISSISHFRFWEGDDNTLINIGTRDEYTHVFSPETTEFSIMIALEDNTGIDPNVFRETFELIEGDNFDTSLELDSDFILSKINAKDLFEITPNMEVVFDKNSPFRNFSSILDTGVVATSATNNLTFERMEVRGGEEISTSPIRAFAEYDENDIFIGGTWKGDAFNFQSYNFILNQNTKYIRATVPRDGTEGVTSLLENFRVVYGSPENLLTDVIYDLKMLEGGKINVYSSDTGGDGGGGENLNPTPEETIINNENKNSILKEMFETQGMVDSILAVKGANSISKTINIPGKNIDLSNYVQRVHIHWGTQKGDEQFDEVFMDENCKTDFSDIRFEDEFGNMLDFVVYSHGNYEVIKDNATLLNNTIEFTSDGKLLMSHSTSGTNRSLRISSNNGGTWDVIHTNVNLLYVDSRDIVFVFRHTDYKMLRLLPGENYSTLHEVLDLSETESDIRPLSAFCEDQNGYLYCGKYQGAWDIEIFKSTDEGATWHTVFRDLENNQHVHHISFDPYTNTLYAGLDGAKNYLNEVKRAKNIKSTDGGATWTVVPNPYPNTDYGLAFYGDGYRLGFGETSILGGPTIYKTFDDVNYYPVLNTNQGIRKIVEVDGVLFAGGNAGQANRNAQIYMSKDKGENWETVFWENWQDTSSAGDAVRYFSRHKTPMGETEPQTLIGGNGSYSRLRLLHGGDHYQALAFVKVGSLPSSGKQIKISSDFLVKSPAKTVQTEVLPSSIKGYLKLNEGRGQFLKDQISGLFVEADVAWQNGIRHFDSPYPYSRRDYLPSGIKSNQKIIELPENFNLPNKDFSVCFFGNFFGTYSADKKFLLGDHEGVHFYYQNTGIYVSNGLNSYPVYGLEVPNIQDKYNFFVLSVTNDAEPIFKFTIGDYQYLSRAMTTWENVPSLKTYLLNQPSLSYSKGDCKIHSLMVFDRMLSDEECRLIYFGQDVI